jgi:hypothetical protein
MIENRIKKLAHEEERLRKQIEIANKHTNFAMDVNDRRKSDFNNKAFHQECMEEHRSMLYTNNQMRREENKKNIHYVKGSVHAQHQTSGINLRIQAEVNAKTVHDFKNKDVRNKMYNAASSYTNRNKSLHV